MAIKTRKVPAKRNPMAFALQHAIFRKRIVENKKTVYNRKKQSKEW